MATAAKVADQGTRRLSVDQCALSNLELDRRGRKLGLRQTRFQLVTDAIALEIVGREVQIYAQPGMLEQKLPHIADRPPQYRCRHVLDQSGLFGDRDERCRTNGFLVIELPARQSLRP